ncbi:MAG: DNA mismatch repair endonuclease MutL [Dehalococcoidia bacterium]|nr:DNA mismatch repair endonuclease MutL [Dehalococcoidia bacterium]
MSIRILEPAVASAIAAGEVIERPAAVVKELVENSIDAGASRVAIEIEQGGLKRIRVADDGVGIAPGDLETAFQRHATSKLRTLDDLDALRTLGFRGEALPSIAAAARVRLVSRQADGEGAAIELEAGSVLSKGPAGAPPGVTVSVEALFSALPARLKFLRSTGAETGRVRHAVENLALAYPNVAVIFSADGKTLLRTPGGGAPRDAFAAVHGAELAEAMLDLAPSPAAPFRVTGLISPPAHSRPNRAAIRLFVNGRWVQSRALSVAVEEAYAGLLMQGRYPIAVVMIEAPPHEVDANVHPNKREVRFAREGDAFSSVQRSVRESLLAAVPVVDARPFERPAAPDGALPAANPFSFTVAASPTPPPLPFGLGDGAAAPQPAPAAADAAMPRLRVLGQVSNTYIVAEGPDGMYLVDQHAAHESVLYYRLLRQWEEDEPDVQLLLEPQALEATPEQQERLTARLDNLRRYGFGIEEFGGAWLVRSVPAMGRSVDAGVLIADLLAESDASPTGGEAHRAMASSIACHSAIRAGQALDQQEMTALVQALEASPGPPHCPHGRPTAIRLTTGMLEREFGRV